MATVPVSLDFQNTSETDGKRGKTGGRFRIINDRGSIGEVTWFTGWILPVCRFETMGQRSGLPNEWLFPGRGKLDGISGNLPSFFALTSVSREENAV